MPLRDFPTHHEHIPPDEDIPHQDPVTDELFPLSPGKHLLFILLFLVLSIPSVVGCAIILRWLWRHLHSLTGLGALISVIFQPPHLPWDF